MLPTDEAMRHGSLVNAILNASLRFAKERGDYRAMPFTFEQAQHFLINMRAEGITVYVELRRKTKESGKTIAQQPLNAIAFCKELSSYNEKELPHGLVWHELVRQARSIAQQQ